MKKTILFSSLVFLASGCVQENIEIEYGSPTFEKAVVSISPVGDTEVSGIITFTKEENGVKVEGEISGLTEGNHGFHIHQFGDCTASDGTSAGGHYNPSQMEHSSPESQIRHMGDMGNITGNSDGVAVIDYTDMVINIDMIIGRGVIVHGGEDDLSSQPSGAAGPRIGCGVIGVQE